MIMVLWVELLIEDKIFTPMTPAIKCRLGIPPNLSLWLYFTRAKGLKLTSQQLSTFKRLAKKTIVRLLVALLMIEMLPGALFAQKLDLSLPLAIKWFNKISEGVRFAAAYGSNAVNLSLASGKLMAVQVSSGQLIWQADLGGKINNIVADNQFVFVLKETSYTLGGDVFPSSEVSLLALSQKSGLTVWHRSLPTTLRGGISSDETTLFFVTSTGVAYAVSKATGETMWLKRIAPTSFLSVLVKDGDVFLCSEKGSLTSLKAKDGSFNWHYQTGDVLHSAIAVTGNYLSVGGDSGQVYCLNKNTGQLRWRSLMNGEMQNLIAVDDGFIASASDNYAYFFSVSLGRRIWKRRFTGRIVASPLVEGRTALFVCLGSNEGVILSLKNGKFLNRVQAGENNVITAAPIVVNETLLVPTHDGLIAFTSRS